MELQRSDETRVADGERFGGISWRVLMANHPRYTLHGHVS